MAEPTSKFSNFDYIIRLFFYQSILFFVNLLILFGDLIILSIRYILRLTMRLILYSIKLPKRIVIQPLFSLSTLIRSLFRRKIKFPPVRIKIRVLKLSKIRYFVFGFTVALTIIFIFICKDFIKSLPDPKLIGKVNFAVSTQILDRKGRLLYEVYGNENRIPVKVNSLPKHVVQATIAIEDKDFYKHNGISVWGGILRAMKDSILKSDLQGGSTITQQLVKSSLLTPERTIERKIKEMIIALQVEKIFTKDQILEMYLNQVPYGGTAYGIQQASHVYFDKDAKDLTMGEMAYLAGLPKAPSIYSYYANPEYAKLRRNEVLVHMRDLKYISGAEYDHEIRLPLDITPLKQQIRAPHFVFYVKNLLEQKYGIRSVETRGFRVRTSLDLDIQNETELILAEELKKIENLQVSNGAVLITYPSTGEVLAMIGSKNYYEDGVGAFNVTTAQRQPGSSIKPLMYSLALTKGFTTVSQIDDSPIIFKIPGSKPYRPVNYDARFHGLQTLRSALANSYNVPAVKVLNTLGVNDFIVHARNLGITTWNNPERFGLSLTLGGGEVKLTDMAVAYGVFANSGFKVDLNPILDIYDYQGYPIEINTKVDRKEVLDEGISYLIYDILSDKLARIPAFGAYSPLNIPDYKVAVKTGTTNEKKDNWTIGFTPKFLTGVWVGNNDNKPMNPLLTSGITGAAPIWSRIMISLLAKNISEEFEMISKVTNNYVIPANIVEKKCNGKSEYFIKGTENAPCYSSSITPTPGR